MKKVILMMVLGIGTVFSTQAQWSNTGNNLTSGTLRIGPSIPFTTKQVYVKGTGFDHMALFENTNQFGNGMIISAAVDPLRVGGFNNHFGNLFIVKGDGRVGISTTSPLAGYKLDVNGKVNMNGFYSGQSSTVNGNLTIYGTSSAFSHSTISDRRFKKNIKEDFSAFQKLYDVKTYQYQYKDFNSDQDQYGVMAQELTEIFPEMVNGTEEEGYSVNYTAMIPLLVRAIQDQKQTIDALQEQLNLLTDKIAESPKLADVLDIEPDAMTIFPNPANGTTNIALKGSTKGNVTLEVVNLNGEVVQELKNKNSKTVAINTSGLLKGVYFVRYLRDGELIETKKLLVRK